MDESYVKEMAVLQAEHWWYQGRRNVISKVIESLNLSKDSKILEAGCGPGGNLKMLSHFGDVRAFEPDSFSVEHSKELSGLDIQTGTLPEGMPFDEKFDLVCAFDVIEHIDDDKGSVKALCEHTKDDGYALFTVPAFQFLWSKHDVMNHHKRRYTKNEFKHVLVSAGYDVEFISYYNFFLFPLAAGIRLVKNALKIDDKGSDAQMPGTKFVNDALIFVFSSERHIIPKMALPFGLSIIAVCKKKKT